MGWLAALKMVPWADVVSSAPVLADGAKKLWKAVARGGVAPTAGDDRAAAGAAEAPALLQARIALLESKVADLEREMMASSELIKALAEQNARLVEALAAFRLRQRLWFGALAVLAIAALALAAAVYR